MSNSMDPDETVHYEPSHLDLCCLLKHIIISYGSKGVNQIWSYMLVKCHKMMMHCFESLLGRQCMPSKMIIGLTVIQKVVLTVYIWTAN